MGLDVGERRIGVALSDPEANLASPIGIVERGAGLNEFEAILKLVEEHQVERIVVGLPLSLDGRPGPQARRTYSFCQALRARSRVPVETWDERLTTVEADRLLREAGVKGSREKGRRDAAAAAIMLQAYLDARHHRAN